MAQQTLPQQIPQEIHQEIHQEILQLIHERNTLLTELQYAHSTITELTSQCIETERLCTLAQNALKDRPTPTKPKAATPFPSTPRPTNKARNPQPSSWICETWLLLTTTTPSLLGPSETAWSTGHPQHALNHLSTLLSRPNLLPHDRINAKLLRAAILHTWEQTDGALNYADEALGMARRHQLWGLAGKAQFFRGLCFLDHGSVADAGWCFTLAAHTEGYAKLVQRYSEIAEVRRGKLRAGNSRGLTSAALM